MVEMLMGRRLSGRSRRNTKDQIIQNRDLGMASDSYAS